MDFIGFSRPYLPALHAAPLLRASLSRRLGLPVLSIPWARAVTHTFPLSGAVSLARAIRLALALTLIRTIGTGAGRILGKHKAR